MTRAGDSWIGERRGAERCRPNLTLTVGPAANGGSCVARHDGRVVFVRYALPGEMVKARVIEERGSHWHAEAVEVDRAVARPRRLAVSRSPGVDGAGCCDLAFATPRPPGASRGTSWPTSWSGSAATAGTARPRRPDRSETGRPPAGGPGCGWNVAATGRAGGFTAITAASSSPISNAHRCLPGMLAGLDGAKWPPGAQLHVALDDDGDRGTSCSPDRAPVARPPRSWWRAATRRCSGGGRELARAGHRVLAGASRRGRRIQRAGRGTGRSCPRA